MKTGRNKPVFVGIIGAMEEEINVFKKHMHNVKKVEKAGISYYKGLFSGVNVVVGQSGIGKVNAAVCTQIMIDLFEVDFIICCGVAGAVDNSIKIGDVVISTSAVQHDVIVSTFGYKPGQIPRMDVVEFPADEKLVKLAYKAGRSVLTQNRVHLGKVLTGDRFIQDTHEKTRLREVFEGSCVEMEGAAIAHVCYLNNLPYVIIRSISDTADGKASEDYDKFANLAVDNSFKIVRSLLKQIKDVE